MHAYLNRMPVEITPAFRADRKGPTLGSASFSVPLRYEDLVSILYHVTVSGPMLGDADVVREAIVEALVNHGGQAIAADKARLETAVAANTLDNAARVRLAVCQRRITDLFGRPDTGLRDPSERSPLYRRAA